MKLCRKNILFFTVICFVHHKSLYAQSCDSNYFSFDYNASDFMTYSKAIVTADNSVLCLETNKFYSHGLTKFTPQGNVIFSYKYTAPFTANGNHSWTDLAFTDIAAASESSYYITGSVTKHGAFYDNTETPPARTAAVIVKVDKYGKVIWSRFFANATTDPLAFSNIITLSNGDIVGYLTTQLGLPFYGRIICLSADGTIKWNITLNTGEYSSGYLPPSNKKSMIQTKNGNIVLADIVYKYNADFSGDGEYHFLALDASSGSVVWETSYRYGDPSFIPNINSIYELPDGSLSFQTAFNGPPLNIITDNKGVIKKMISTYPVDDNAILIDAKSDGNFGNQALLMLTNDGKSILTQIDKNGNLNWSRKYGKSDDKPPVCFIKINDGYDIFLNDFSRSFRMLRTDPIGMLDCDTLAVKMTQETIPIFTEKVNNVHTTDSASANEGPYSTGFFVVQNTSITSIQRNTVCQKNIPCCIDVVDTTHINNVSLCEGDSYKLPDNTIVRDSGRYYVSYKTLKGCDSISLYEISVDKNPSALSLGLDTCFTESDSVTLHATDGYSSYIWDDFTTPSSNYTVHKAGIYSVTVSNVCGSKTDSIHVYEQCEFPIYMPNAFTPNGDRLNDIFKVPSLNLNRLLQFTIYNRWGKIVFQTNDINKGWDGTINNIPQQQGTYAYYLQMESIVGKKINQKGTLTLIR